VNYSIEFGGEPQDITMTLTGALEASEIRGFVEELVSHPEYREGMLILADLSGLNTSGVSVEDYEGISDVIAGRDHRFPAKAIAIVAPDSRTFDDAMQHRAYVGGSKSGREVFRSRDDATAWLARMR
jgi:hypothetical protein